MIALPYEDGRFRCIEIDPPWRYKDRGYNGFDTVQEYRIHCPYQTMTLSDIELMGDEINRVANREHGCHLWLWTTKDFLPDAFDLIFGWGWEYKQLITWVKCSKAEVPTYGMGYWLRNACEYLILAVNRTKKNRPLCATTTPNYIFSVPDGGAFFASRDRHSKKPDSSYEMIRNNSPEPRLSIFQRSEREGFECWGNEMEASA